jgi:hypothetical protein
LLLFPPNGVAVKENARVLVLVRIRANPTSGPFHRRVFGRGRTEGDETLAPFPICRVGRLENDGLCRGAAVAARDEASFMALAVVTTAAFHLLTDPVPGPHVRIERARGKTGPAPERVDGDTEDDDPRLKGSTLCSRVSSSLDGEYLRRSRLSERFPTDRIFFRRQRESQEALRVQRQKKRHRAWKDGR